jgi:hypothetical protein
MPKLAGLAPLVRVRGPKEGQTAACGKRALPSDQPPKLLPDLSARPACSHAWATRGSVSSSLTTKEPLERGPPWSLPTSCARHPNLADTAKAHLRAGMRGKHSATGGALGPRDGFGANAQRGPPTPAVSISFRGRMPGRLESRTGMIWASTTRPGSRDQTGRAGP